MQDLPLSSRLNFQNLFQVLRQSVLVIIVSTALFAVANTSKVNEATEQPLDDKHAAVNEFNKDDKTRVLIRLAELLDDLYVFPEIGDKYAAYLRHKASKLTSSNKQAFVEQISKELQKIHADAHLRLELDENTNRDKGPNDTPPPKSLNKLLYLSPKIPYLRFDTLWGDPETMANLHEFIDASNGIDSMIIDLRKNRGGGLAEIDLFASQLFAKPTDLLIMEVRRTIYEMEGGPFGEGPSLQRIDSPIESVRLMHSALPAESPRFLDTRLYILTSSSTASAAEHFALAMQRTGRAILVGEATKGAAHFGGLMPIGSGIRAFIPAGRTYDPDTGKSWESVGVQADLESSSDDALIQALLHFGLSEDLASEMNQMVSDGAE